MSSVKCQSHQTRSQGCHVFFKNHHHCQQCQNLTTNSNQYQELTFLTSIDKTNRASFAVFMWHNPCVTIMIQRATWACSQPSRSHWRFNSYIIFRESRLRHFVKYGMNGKQAPNQQPMNCLQVIHDMTLKTKFINLKTKFGTASACQCKSTTFV